MANNTIRIRGVFDDQVSTKIDRLRDRFDTMGKSKGFQSIAQGVGLGAGLKAWDLIGNAAGRAVDYIGDSIDAASDQREALALNAQVFDTAADRIDHWSDTSAKAFGEAKTDAINYAAQFGNVMKAAGESTDKLAAKSIALTERAADLGSAFNATGEEVSAALRSGLVGESEPLRRFGILLDEASVKAKGVEMGLADAHGEMSAGEKVLARYQLIMDASAGSAGMFGRDTESLADAQKILNAELADLSAKIGEEFTPAALDATRAVTGLVDAIGEIQGSPAGDVLGFLGDLAGGLHGVSKESDDLVKRYYEQQQAAEAGAKATDVAFETVQNRLRGMKMPNPDWGKLEPPPTIAPSIVDIAKAFDRVADAAASAAQAVIEDAFDPIMAANDLVRQNAEANAIREEIASGKLKGAKLRDAKDTYDQIMKLTAGDLVTLAKSGDTHSKAYKTGLANLEKYVARSSGATVEGLEDVLDEIDKVERAGASVPIRFKITARIYGSKLDRLLDLETRAEGGPVRAGVPYIVGERGSEWFVPKQDGTIVPHGVGAYTLGRPLDDGGGVHINVNYNVGYSTASPAEAQRFMRAITPELAREWRRQGLLP